MYRVEFPLHPLTYLNVMPINQVYAYSVVCHLFHPRSVKDKKKKIECGSTDELWGPSTFLCSFFYYITLRYRVNPREYWFSTNPTPPAKIADLFRNALSTSPFYLRYTAHFSSLYFLIIIFFLIFHYFWFNIKTFFFSMFFFPNLIPLYKL